MNSIETFLANPVGYNMPGLVERLNYIKDVVDLSSWKVITDIGACDGWESANFAAVFSDAEVYSFEPSPYNVARWNTTYSQQSDDVKRRLFLVQAAVTNVTGPIEFYAIDEEIASQHGVVNNGMGSTLKIVDPRVLPWHYCIQKQVTAEGYALDDWCKLANIPQVDAMWIDVQGAELNVLQGAQHQLENVQVVMTEAGLIPYYHGHQMQYDIDQFLISKGFIELKDAQQVHDQKLELNAIYVNRKFAKL